MGGRGREINVSRRCDRVARNASQTPRVFRIYAVRTVRRALTAARVLRGRRRVRNVRTTRDRDTHLFFSYRKIIYTARFTRYRRNVYGNGVLRVVYNIPYGPGDRTPPHPHWDVSKPVWPYTVVGFRGGSGGAGETARESISRRPPGAWASDGYRSRNVPDATVRRTFF